LYDILLKYLIFFLNTFKQNFKKTLKKNKKNFFGKFFSKSKEFFSENISKLERSELRLKINFHSSFGNH